MKNKRIWKCCHCSEEFTTRALLSEHRKQKHPQFAKRGAWNKGLTAKNSDLVAKGKDTYHKNFENGKFHGAFLGHKHSDEVKKQISNSMKIAHNEGRAWNIGQSRWNNEPSYPEKWFINVIANEFENKKYVRELPFHRFSLDFAWKDLKRCIEIDGKQHYEDEKQHNRDLHKNALLEKEGWKILRIDWRKCFNDPKFYIQLAKDFIDS